MFFLKENSYFDIEDVNRYIKSSPDRLIHRYESLFSSEMSRVARQVYKRDVRLIMLTGPSSSGKTTTSHKLSRELGLAGISTVIISLDNFFKHKRDFPRGKDGRPDYESVDGLELELLRSKLSSLIRGEETRLPQFDFIEGRRTDDVISARLSSSCVAIIEGIHALNQKVIGMLPKESYLAIYISAHSGFCLNNRVILPKRDVRLLRRMVRDYRTRGSSPHNTFSMWPGVIDGEERFIMPTKAVADIRINTTFPYDPCFLKAQAVRLLSAIPSGTEYHEKASQLLRALGPFEEADLAHLPGDALIREFVGGSQFYQ